jgi:nucleoside 2-deoxyribosyltransferase
MRVVYLAGKYTGKDYFEIEANIQKAKEYALEIWNMGHVCICPHLNTCHFEDHLSLPNEEYIRRDLKIVERCDCVFVMPEWEESSGASTEVAFAREKDIPVYFDLDQLKSPIPFEDGIEG